MRCNNISGNITAPAVCSNNMPGVQRLLFIPRKDVESINAVATNVPTNYGERVIIGSPAMVQRAITVKSGKEFAEIYSADEFGELIYTPQGQHGSRSFKAELEIFHPAFKADILGFVAVHNNQELLIVVELNNDQFHLLGTTRRGVRLADSTKVTSGKAVTDANGAECHFEWNTDAPQVFYEGWTPEDDTHGLPLISEE